MPASYSYVVVLGTMVRDIELRYLGSGTPVADFTLAVNKKWVKDGEKKEKTSFIGCVCMGKPAETIAQYVKKGSNLMVAGELDQESWEKEGQKREKTKVSVKEFQFLGGKPEGGSAPSAAPRTQARPAQRPVDDDPDSVPF